MNMPDNVMVAVKEKKTETTEKKVTNTSTLNVGNLSTLDKIISSYNAIQIKKDDYNKKILAMKNDANQLKEKIYTKKNINNRNTLAKEEPIQKEGFKKKIEDNNYSINEETCDTTIDYINVIRSNISNNSKAASEALTPLETSFNLLKTQVQYTLLLENILESFNKRNELEGKIGESDQIITKLAQSLNIEL
jgi:hypothetical protein